MSYTPHQHVNNAHHIFFIQYTLTYLHVRELMAARDHCSRWSFTFKSRKPLDIFNKAFYRFINLLRLMFHKDQIYSFPYPNQLFLCLSVTKTCIYKLQHGDYEETFLLAVELDV